MNVATLVVRAACIFSLALAASHSGAAAAAAKPIVAPTVPPIHATEQALEVSMDQLRLPDGATGALLVDPCARCMTKSLSLDAQSLIFINGKAVSLDVLRQRIAQRKASMATVLYSSANMRLTRLLVFSR